MRKRELYLGEDPWMDIAGYAILMLKDKEEER